MKRLVLRKLFRHRPLLAALTFAGAAVLASALLPVRANAVCSTYVLIDYFFDAAKTQYAGTCVRPCNGAYNCHGTITSYRIVESEPCGC